MELKVKRIIIITLAVAFLISTGTFAYTYTTATGTINVIEPTGDIVSCNASATQPDWDSILDDLSTENKTAGEVPSGDLFNLSPDATFGGNIVAKVYLANAGDLIKAFSYLNMKLYLAGSAEAGETPNYRMLTLQNGEAMFTLEDLDPTTGSWTQTSQGDFEGGTLNQVDTTTSPGDVILDTFADNVTDTFADQTKIADSANVTISGGQVKLDYTSGSSDNETLRPTADGDETNIEDPASPATHWNLVDDVTPDEDSTYVSSEEYTWQEDLYQIADHSTGSGVINYVRVYFRAYEEVNEDPDTNVYAHIKTNGVEYNGTAIDVATSYTTYYYQWDYNPQTSANWTWSEIDALQIGVGIMRAKPNRYTHVTQVYAEINYTDVSYYSSGTIDSINLLSGETVKSIDSFDYDASAVPSGTSLKVQFSQDNTNWYNSAGTPGGWDTLSQGTNNIDLSGLGWSGPNFYYHMLFTSDGNDTPVLDEIRVNFSTYYASGDLTSSSHDNGYDLA